MRKYLSSIFSFDTLSLSSERPRGTLRAIALCVFFFLGAELGARVLLNGLDRHWMYWSPTAAVKFEAYRSRLEAGNAPDVLVIGDSTAARNIDPAHIADAVPKLATSMSVGLPGYVLKAMERDFLPLLEQGESVPKVAVVSFLPLSCTEHHAILENEKQIFASRYFREIEGEHFVGDYFYLARLLDSRSLIRQSLRKKGPGQELPANGFMPLRGRSPDWDLFAVGPDEGPPELSISEERFSILKKLADICRARNIRLVFAVPPTLDNRLFSKELAQMYADRLRTLATEDGVHTFDGRTLSTLEEKHYWDPLHLNRDGAQLFGDWLAEAMRAEGSDLRLQ